MPVHCVPVVRLLPLRLLLPFSLSLSASLPLCLRLPLCLCRSASLSLCVSTRTQLTRQLRFLWDAVSPAMWCPRMSAQTQRAEALAGRAQLAVTACNWAEAIALFETALRELTQHPETLSPTASGSMEGAQEAPPAAAEATPTKTSGASDGAWYRVAMPALLRAGPSLSSRALERLEVGGVVQALVPEVECEGRRRVQVAGNLYGRGWCSLETANGQPILRPLPVEATYGQATP